MRPRPGPDGTGRPDTPVSAAAVLEVAAGLRELDPRLSAELARHAVRLAGTDGELRGAAERVAARSLVEGRRGVEVVERVVPTLRSAVRRGARADELEARCDLAVAALRCRASALAAALVAPLDPAELPPASRAVATLRVAQVRAAEGDVEATDRAVARAREDHGDGGDNGVADPLVGIDLDRARGEARRRRGDAAACATVLGELRGRVPDTSDLDGGRRAAALAADHVAALVDAGALDDARAQAASWRGTSSTPATCLGLGRLRVVVAGRLHLPAAPEEAETVAWSAERDLADGAHHREAAEAARVVAEAAELRGRWPEAVAALRRSRAHDARAGEEERTVDRLLAGVLGYADGLATTRGGTGLREGDEAAHADAPVGSRPSAPATSVPELATPPTPPEPGPGTTVPPAPADDAVLPGTAPRRRRRRAPDDAPPADGTSGEPGAAATTVGGVGGRRRRRDPDEEPVESREFASAEPGRPRHGRSDAAGAPTDRTARVAGEPEGEVGVGDGEEGPRQEPRLDSPSRDAFSTAPERPAGPDVDGVVGAPGAQAHRSPRHPHAGRDADADVTAGPERDPVVDHEDPLGIGRLLARSSPERTSPGPASPGPASPGSTSPEARSPARPVPDHPGDGPTARTRDAATPEPRPLSDLGPATAESRTGRTASPADADELPLTLVGLLAEYDLPDVGRPVAPRPDGTTGPGAPRRTPGPAASAPSERGRDGRGGADDPTGDGAGDDGGARLADLLADAMDAFRRTAPETGPTAGRGTPGGRSPA